MHIYIAADHRGFSLKNELVNSLKDEGHTVDDLGAQSLDPNDDYPNFAQKVAQEVVKDSGSFGILLCGSGVGVDIAANKFDGIRAGLGLSSEQVKKGREDDNINILIIASDFTSAADAKNMSKTFVDTNYEKNERHERRLEEIKKIESL